MEIGVLLFEMNNWALLFILILIVSIGYIFYKAGKRVSDKKIAEETNRRSTQLKEQFLANMSHEFRTPLNAIVGMTRLLRDNKPKPDQMNYLNAIAQSSENLMAIINDILDISKIEAGRIVLNSIPFDPRVVLKNLEDSFHLKAEEKNITYNVTVDESVPEYLRGDPLRLAQVLGNVVSNAIKFTDQGSVDLICRLKSNSDAEGNHVVLLFSIQDTGIGIEESNLQTIFSAFNQESGDTTRKYGGAGLGLSISKKLVDLFGGLITVDSEPGAGSIFNIELAFEVYTGDALIRKADANAAEIIKSLEGISVLLVEDIEFNRIVALDTLSNDIDNIQIEIAANGNEAVKMCLTKHFDVILMDLQMPELNGYDATRQIRALPQPACHIPIIAVTASALEDEIYRCYEAGMNDFITKPFDKDILFRKISNQLVRMDAT